MAIFKLFLYFVILLVFIGTGLTFSFRNNSLIDVDLLFIQSSSFSTGFWLIATLLIGFILGIVLTYPKRLFQKIKNSQSSKKYAANNLPSTRANSESNKGN